MKKSLLILLAPVISLISCGPTEPENPEPIDPPAHTHVDENHDHVCDQCFQKASDCIDANEDYICDICGAELEQPEPPIPPEPIKDVWEIVILSAPNKTSYLVGEYFNPEGMVVQAEYDDESRTKEIIDSYSYNTNPLGLSDTEIIISYGGKSTTVAIVVKEQSEPLDEYTYTYDFNNDLDFASFGDACGFGDSGNKDELVNYFDEQLEMLNLIDDLEISGKVMTRKRADDSKYYLQFGSQSETGKLKWISIEKIYKVEIEVINYTKGEYSADLNAAISIDSEKHDISVKDKSQIQKHTFSKEYSEGVTNFTLASSLGRVLLSKLTITWRG